MPTSSFDMTKLLLTNPDYAIPDEGRVQSAFIIILRGMRDVILDIKHSLAAVPDAVDREMLLGNIRRLFPGINPELCDLALQKIDAKLASLQVLPASQGGKRSSSKGSKRSSSKGGKRSRKSRKQKTQRKQSRRR